MLAKTDHPLKKHKSGLAISKKNCNIHRATLAIADSNGLTEQESSANHQEREHELASPVSRIGEEQKRTAERRKR